VTGYLVRRLAWAALLFLVMSFVTYLIFFVIPTESSTIGRGQASETIDLRTVIPLEGSLVHEYAQFVGRVLHGDLGRSYVTRREVSEILLQAAPVTASLVFGGAIVWMLIAVPVGLLSALRPRSVLDRFATVFVLIGISAHPVWIGLILSYVFGEKLGLAPVGGYCDLVSPATSCGGPLQWAWHLWLPWLTFALMFAAIYMRMVRASVLEALGEDYVRTARAKGASETQVVRSHVLRDGAPTGRDDAGDGHRARARRRCLRRAGLRPSRARRNRDPEPRAARPAGDHGRRSLRHVLRDRPQPDRGPRLYGDRPA
jgi:peptide/nickel transport system permease protein